MSGMERTTIEPASGDALVIVDVQNDFLPGGALAVPESDQILPFVNTYIATFEKRRLPIYMTRDWHPPDHCSFKESGGPWPTHCVAGTHGAAFSEKLKFNSSFTVAATNPKSGHTRTCTTSFEPSLRAAGYPDFRLRTCDRLLHLQHGEGCTFWLQNLSASARSRV
jgi:nicotinamidase/pyrazinamidase